MGLRTRQAWAHQGFEIIVVEPFAVQQLMFMMHLQPISNHLDNDSRLGPFLALQESALISLTVVDGISWLLR